MTRTTGPEDGSKRTNVVKINVVDFSTDSNGGINMPMYGKQAQAKLSYRYMGDDIKDSMSYANLSEVFRLFGPHKKNEKRKYMRFITLLVIIVEILVVCFLIGTMHVRIWNPEYGTVDLNSLAKLRSDGEVSIPKSFIEECCSPIINESQITNYQNNVLDKGFIGTGHYLLVSELEINGAISDQHAKIPVCCVCNKRNRSIGVSTDNVGILAALILLSALVQRSLSMESIFLFSSMCLMVVIIIYGQQLSLTNRDVFNILSTFPGGREYFDCVFVSLEYQRTQPTSWFFLVYFSLKSLFTFLVFTMNLLYKFVR